MRHPAGRRAKRGAKPSQIRAGSVAEPATKKCPYCAENVQAKAIKCRYCGSSLVPRRLSVSSPWLGIASLAIGMAGGVSEILTLAGVNKGTPSTRPFLAAAPTNSHDGPHIALLVTALVVGVAGLAGALLARRHPKAGVTTLLGAGVAGLAMALFVGRDYFVLGLSALLIAGAVATALVRTRVGPA